MVIVPAMKHPVVADWTAATPAVTAVAQVMRTIPIAMQIAPVIAETEPATPAKIAAIAPMIAPQTC